MELLIRLLIAHFITDFFLQPDSWVAGKKRDGVRSKFLYYHILLTGLVVLATVGSLKLWYVAVIIAVSHFCIDAVKISYGKDNLAHFLMDQLAHLVVIIVCASCFGEGPLAIPIDVFSQSNLMLFAAYLFVTKPAGILVGMFTKRWHVEIDPSGDRDSLDKAGQWIGMIERLLVLTFVLVHQYQAIGFLIAAKSILRFSDRKENIARKQTEYVLIGTLLSFSIALLVGLTVIIMTK